MNTAILENLVLKCGSHDTREDGVCAMEAVAWIAEEDHSDRPEGECPIIGAFLRSWNDSIPTDEERTALIKPLLVLVVGTKSAKEIETKRGWMCADWLVHEFYPTWLDACGQQYAVHTAVLRLAPEITNLKSVLDLSPVFLAIGKQSDADWRAARDEMVAMVARDEMDAMVAMDASFRPRAISS